MSSFNSLPLVLASHGIEAPAAQAAVTAAFGVLDEFLKQFNARDARAWARTLHFPHLRIAGGEVQSWATAEDYAAANDLEAFAQTGWSHTRWDWLRPVQADADKVHVALQFTRYDAAEQPIASFQALYVLTRADGRWGIQLRSSYAGIATPNAAF